MIELFGSSSPNVTKITIALEELGQAYNIRPVDIWKGDQFTDEFTRLNLNRRVPVIVDSDGPGGKEIVVFESGAILIYLAEKFGYLLPSEPRARFESLQWMMIQMTGIGPMFGQFVHFANYAQGDNTYALERYRSEVLRLYKLLETRLEGSEYLGGDAYSLADVATIPWILNPFTAIEAFFRDDAGSTPNIGRWIVAVRSRRAVQTGLAVAERLRASLTRHMNATPEERDRVFGRGRFSRGKSDDM